MAKQFRENVEIISSAANTSWLRLNNLTSPNATTYAGILAHDASGNVVSISGSTIATVTVSNVAPATPVLGQQWLDTSVTPSELKIWNGTSRVAANDEVQYYTNFAAFPVTGDPDVVYVDLATDSVYLWDTTTSAYVSAVGWASGLFSITDGTTTEAIGVSNTITFNEQASVASVLDLKVLATDIVQLQAVAGHTVGQAIVSDGTNLVYGNPVAARYTNTQTYTANTAVTHTHGLATADPIVQVRDAVTNEIVDVEIVIISATQFTVTSTVAGSHRVVAL